MFPCIEKYGWTDADAENSTRYFMMRAIAENSEKALSAEQVEIVRGYFSDNRADFVGMPNFLNADPESIVIDLSARGIPSDEQSQTDAAPYLYWTVLVERLRSDFVAGKLRD